MQRQLREHPGNASWRVRSRAYFECAQSLANALGCSELVPPTFEDFERQSSRHGVYGVERL